MNNLIHPQMRAGDCIYANSTHRINIHRLLPLEKDLYTKLALDKISELLSIDLGDISFSIEYF